MIIDEKNKENCENEEDETQCIINKREGFAKAFVGISIAGASIALICFVLRVLPWNPDPGVF